MKITDLELVDVQQDIYDSFNGFMISSDLKVFGKMLARTLLVQKVQNVPGDIIECGIFKGTGFYNFLKLKRHLMPNTGKKIIGFDFFDTTALLNSLQDQNKEAMDTLFTGRGFGHEESFYRFFQETLARNGFEKHECELIKGDVSVTVPDYLAARPGLKISLLYMDLDLEKPTYDVLDAAWERLSHNGIVVFDEYAYHQWSESIGVDRFFADKKVDIKSLNFLAPSAYVVKK
tara:strand:+ start:15936 stop:16631 length:696 start_codon:yes stop_codon:yes gene_type:complete